MTDDFHDPIERLLREDARRKVPDAGFSARMAARLPPRRGALPWLRPVLVIGAAAIGGALAWLLAPAGTSLARGYLDLAHDGTLSPSALSALGLALAMAVAAVVLVVEER